MDTSVMGLAELWQVALGILLPLVIAVVTRASWSARRKSATMLAFVLVTTTVGMLIQGQLVRPATLDEWVSAVLVVFITTVTTYRHIWKPTEVAPKIETSVNSDPDLEAPSPDDQPWGGVGM